jgi:hypothetical protein
MCPDQKIEKTGILAAGDVEQVSLAGRFVENRRI